MSEVAVVCPHCGEVDPARDRRVPAAAAPKPGGIGKLSSEEAGALLAVSGASERPPAFWRDYLLPHRRLEGALVLVDLVLIVLTLPLIAGIVITLFWGDNRERVATVSGSYAANMGIAFVGGLVFVVAMWTFGALDVAWPLALVGAVALLARVTLASWGAQR